MYTAIIESNYKSSEKKNNFCKNPQQSSKKILAGLYNKIHSVYKNVLYSCLKIEYLKIKVQVWFLQWFPGYKVFIYSY